jgi:hypothetical protein
MEELKCDICLQQFARKVCLDKHLKRKNKCNIVTDYQCSNCQKYFRHKKNLLEHMHNAVCIKNKPINNENKIENNEKIDDNQNIKDVIKAIINSEKFDLDSKIDLLKDYNIKISEDKLKKVIDSDMIIDDIIKYIYSHINKSSDTTINNNINNGTINTNNLNTTNNIQINNFGNEKLEYLNNEYFKDLLLNNHIQTAYMKLIEDTYLHKEHPENKTIKIENLNSKYGFVFENGTWRAIVKYELKEIMHEKNNKLLKIHYKRLKELLNTAKRSSINVFFSRIYDSDPHLKLMNDQMVLLFYEGKPKNVV